MDTLDALVHRWIAPARERFSSTAEDRAEDVARMASASATAQPTDGETEGTTIEAPSPWADPVYRSFMDVVRGQGPPVPGDGAGAGSADGSTYQRLMATEPRVLDTVDRVVNDARFLEARDSQFLEQPLRAILDRTARTLMEVFQELMQARSIDAVILVFRQEGRPLYFGIALMIIVLVIIVLG